MLDTPSLRVAFGVVALTMLALFYFVSYRTTRSAYSAWWCAALGLFVGGASGYLFNGTVNQVWANPLANVLVVTGGACVWAGARSLWTSSPPWWQVAALPLVVGAFSVPDDPAENIWAGGPFYLGAMWVLLGLAAVELWRLQRAHAAAAPKDGGTYSRSLWSITGGCALVAAYYFGRWVAFLAVGWRDPVFETYFGSNPTTLLNSVLLVTVSFSMSTLSDEQQKAALRHLAARDGLTGLFNRSEFLLLAQASLTRIRAECGQGQLILADLDHFKQINDQQGHLAGDHAIATIEEAVDLERTIGYADSALHRAKRPGGTGASTTSQGWHRYRASPVGAGPTCARGRIPFAGVTLEECSTGSWGGCTSAWDRATGWCWSPGRPACPSSSCC